MTASDYTEMLSGLRTVFESGRTRSFQWRKSQLLALATFLRERESEIAQAVYSDFRKSEAETWLTETGFLLGEIRYALKHLRQWMTTKRATTPLIYLFGKSRIVREPHGVVLIIGAWNYPLNLCLSPLVGALAGGNCVVLKPSELTPCTSQVIEEGLRHYLDPEAVRIVRGGAQETRELLQERFDHIFFTGSRDKGREIMHHAARHLTSLTLELGGKCPCIVTAETDLRIAARRIVWAKFLNAGQTCIAPDYVLVHRDAEERLLASMREAIRHFYGSNPQESADYPRIINEAHYRRLSSYLNEGTIVEGGETDHHERYIAPTIIREVGPQSQVMEDEIFGPVLPLIPFSSLDEAIGMIQEGTEPLAVYLFSNDSSTCRRVMEGTRSGGVCINDLLFQAALSSLPFGGRGRSGMGSYHGRAGFETFTFSRSVLHRSLFPDSDLRYPPYGRNKFNFLKRLVGFFSQG
jgi:acyl-CoA reductase-like NAD-dependent aldehyde dehydrogenase